MSFNVYNYSMAFGRTRLFRKPRLAVRLASAQRLISYGIKSVWPRRRALAERMLL